MVSIGADDNRTWLCEKYEPQPERKKEQGLNPQQVKNLLKNAMKGRI